MSRETIKSAFGVTSYRINEEIPITPSVVEDFGHFLNYDILKKWGFSWALKEKFGVLTYVVEYITKQNGWNSFHKGKPITLSVYPHPLIGAQWVIEYTGATTKDDVLFKGFIKDDEALEQILKAIIIFKLDNLKP